jgi:hypothetical protein
VHDASSIVILPPGHFVLGRVWEDTPWNFRAVDLTICQRVRSLP